MFDTLMVFLKEIFEKVDFEKNQQTTKIHEKFLRRQRFRSPFKCTCATIQWRDSKLRENKTSTKISDFKYLARATDCFGLSSHHIPYDNRLIYTRVNREHRGSVVKCLTRDRGAAGLSLTGVLVLCPSARHIYPCLVLVQHRKTRPNITEKLLTGT